MNPTKRVAAILLAAIGLFAATGPGAARADGKWLDSQPLANWNRPGMALPMAPPPQLPIDPRVAARERQPETDEDRMLVANGWRLFTSYQSGWGVRLVFATSYYDGMGRPWRYQAFVFVDGAFAGTLSPELMDSRTDGALDRAQLTGETSIFGEFRRYSPTDPLCCPSGSATVTYRIDRTPTGPVVVPESVMSSAPAAPSGGSATPAPSAAPATPSPTPATPAGAASAGADTTGSATRRALERLGR
jgi:hypothetical protein